MWGGLPVVSVGSALAWPDGAPCRTRSEKSEVTCMHAGWPVVVRGVLLSCCGLAAWITRPSVVMDPRWDAACPVALRTRSHLPCIGGMDTNSAITGSQLANFARFSTFQAASEILHGQCDQITCCAAQLIFA
jgi:hypothetical protein